MLRLFLLLAGILVYNLIGNAQPADPLEVASLLSAICTADPGAQINGEEVYHSELINAFYRDSGFRLAWENMQDVKELLTAIDRSYEEGLEPGDYHTTALRSPGPERSTDRIATDLLMTDAYFHYASHLLNGKVNPGLLFPGEWDFTPKYVDLDSLLLHALATHRVGTSLQSLLPQKEEYQQLKNQLAFYRELNTSASWKSLPDQKAIRPGDTARIVPLLRERFLASNQGIPAAQENTYDSLLVDQILKFQRNHGLKPDGVVGKDTYEALNLAIRDYVDRIIINLERYRWLPRHPAGLHVQVNIPAFQLELNEGDSVLMHMRIIVGRADRKTPVFNSAIRYVIINPTWTVPPTILKEDVLPAVRKSRYYLVRNGLKVIDRQGQEINADSLPWSTYTYENFPYQLRQDPGEHNALGRIKFQFPNQHRVYLHDTNSPWLFNESIRSLSSGCIRIERPVKLAVALIGDPAWREESLQDIISTGETKTINLRTGVPIYLEYFTAFVDRSEGLQIRKDIYDYDQKTLRALQAGKVIK